MSRRIAVCFIFAAMLVAGSVAWAHHNMSAIFDFNNRVSFSGILTKLDWRNPHIELVVDVKTGDRVETWSLEGPAPTFFRTRDITKADFEGALNKQVSFEASRARDGSRWGLLRTMTLPGNKLVSACPQNC